MSNLRMQCLELARRLPVSMQGHDYVVRAAEAFLSFVTVEQDKDDSDRIPTADMLNRDLYTIEVKAGSLLPHEVLAGAYRVTRNGEVIKDRDGPRSRTHEVRS